MQSAVNPLRDGAQVEELATLMRGGVQGTDFNSDATGITIAMREDKTARTMASKPATEMAPSRAKGTLYNSAANIKDDKKALVNEFEI